MAFVEQSSSSSVGTERRGRMGWGRALMCKGWCWETLLRNENKEKTIYIMSLYTTGGSVANDWMI